MASLTPVSPVPPSSSVTSPEKGEQIWTCGTLRYNKTGLLILFAWLLCNDLCLLLMEQVAPQLTPLLLKDHGASNKEIAFFMSTLTGVFTVWINPVVSTWSDRHRSPYGRRRPFLFFSAPILALFLGLLPFAPRIAGFLGLSSTAGAVIVIGLCYLCYSIFNSVILAIFTYYFWDVVPEALLGRFSALNKIVSTLAHFIWSYFIFGLADKHMEAIFVCLAAFFLVVYLVSMWRVKEGDYPPPPPRKSEGFIVPLKAYFTECFSQPYYLWVYAARGVWQVAIIADFYQIFYFRDTLGFDLKTIGQMRAWPMLLMVVAAYPLGALIDRLKPIRLVPPALFIGCFAHLYGFFFVSNTWTLLAFCTITAIGGFIVGISYSVLNVEVFPRERLGQFCSATALIYNIVSFSLAVPLGMLFDWLKDYRYCFLWAAFFQVVSALMFIKVYNNWKKVGGRPPAVEAA